MTWMFLIAGIVLEVAATVFLKFSHGFTRALPSLVTVVFSVLSFGALALALKQMPASFVYAAWSALGTVLIAAVGMLWLGEPASSFRLFSILLIVVGVVCLNISA